MGDVLVSAQGIGKRFGAHVVLEDISLDVHAGEVVALIGPNGGGKSTLLLAMAGLIRVDPGELLVTGRPAHQVALEAQGTVGLITATPGLYALLSGWENVCFFGALYGLDDKTCRERVGPLADELGLTPHMNERVGAYSSGMQQKVSVLRALLMDPPVLLLDEPTANLDPLAASIIHRTAREHADRGHCVIWVTHDLHSAEQICDRAALVSRTVHHVETFDGPRGVPADTQLKRRWRETLEGGA